MTSSIKYRPEIDGLRALAILPVVLFHSGVSWLPGGFVGVDVFFVISGFLITSILLHAEPTGSYSLLTFWSRRIRRILPAFLTVLLSAAIVSATLIHTSDAAQFGTQGLAAITSLANIYYWKLGMNYWGPQAEDSPFLHCWSLSVEEQFYLVYPLLLTLLLKYQRRALLSACLLVAGASFTLWCLGTDRHPAAAFYLLPTRAWELAIGCSLAVFQQGRAGQSAIQSTALANCLVGLGFGGILYAYLSFDGQEDLSWRFLFPVVGTALIIAATNSTSAFRKPLTFPPIIYLGKISYSLYLWHWPVLVFGAYLFDTPSPWLSGLTFTALAMTSYHLIENPIRRSRGSLKFIAISFALVGAFLGSLVLFEKRYDTTIYDPVVWQGQRFDVYPDHSPLTGHWAALLRGMVVEKRAPGLEEAFANEGIVNDYGSTNPEIMILGDSHGLMWAGVIDEIAAELQTSICHFSMAGVTPFIEFPIAQDQQLHISADTKYRFDVSRVRLITEWRPLIILVTRWSDLRPENIAAARSFLNWLGDQGLSVILLGQPPELYFGDKNAPEYFAYLNLIPNEDLNQSIRIGNVQRFEEGVALVQQLAADYPFCSAVPIQDLYRNGNRVTVLQGRKVLYTDDDHLSRDGALLAKDRLREAITRLLPSRAQTP